MENRDHHDPEKRDGILKATSSRSGQTGKESTTYDALDHSLMDAPGNLYVAVKTGCALMMLQKCFDELGDDEYSTRAAKMLQLNQASLAKFRTEEGILRANLYSDTDSRVLAAVESLAIPYMLGLTDEIMEPVKKLLLEHVRGCMQEGHCIEETTGGVRLSSKSNNTWVSKVILCFAVMEKVFGINLEEEYPTAMRELAHWCQISAKDDTISDQLLTTERKVIGGCYYPRSASSAIWIY